MKDHKAKITVYESKGGYRWRCVGANGEKIARITGAVLTRAAAVESAKYIADGHGLSYVYKDKRDQYRFRVKGDLWHAMSSESYDNRSDCCRAMALLVTAVVVE